MALSISIRMDLPVWRFQPARQLAHSDLIRKFFSAALEGTAIAIDVSAYGNRLFSGRSPLSPSGATLWLSGRARDRTVFGHQSLAPGGFWGLIQSRKEIALDALWWGRRAIGGRESTITDGVGQSEFSRLVDKAVAPDELINLDLTYEQIVSFLGETVPVGEVTIHLFTCHISLWCPSQRNWYGSSMPRKKLSPSRSTPRTGRRQWLGRVRLRKV